MPWQSMPPRNYQPLLSQEFIPMLQCVKIFTTSRIPNATCWYPQEPRVHCNSYAYGVFVQYLVKAYYVGTAFCEMALCILALVDFFQLFTKRVVCPPGSVYLRRAIVGGLLAHFPLIALSTQFIYCRAIIGGQQVLMPHHHFRQVRFHNHFTCTS